MNPDETTDDLVRQSNALAMEIMMDREALDGHWQQIGALAVSTEEQQEQHAARLGAWLAVASALAVIGCGVFALMASGPLVIRLALTLPLLIIGSAPAFRSFRYAIGLSMSEPIPSHASGDSATDVGFWGTHVLYLVSGISLVTAVLWASSTIIRAVLLAPIVLTVLAQLMVVLLARPRRVRASHAVREKVPVEY